MTDLKTRILKAAEFDEIACENEGSYIVNECRICFVDGGRWQARHTSALILRLAEAAYAIRYHSPLQPMIIAIEDELAKLEKS